MNCGSFNPSFVDRITFHLWYLDESIINDLSHRPGLLWPPIGGLFAGVETSQSTYGTPFIYSCHGQYVLVSVSTTHMYEYVHMLSMSQKELIYPTHMTRKFNSNSHTNSLIHPIINKSSELFISISIRFIG